MEDEEAESSACLVDADNAESRISTAQGEHPSVPASAERRVQTEAGTAENDREDMQLAHYTDVEASPFPNSPNMSMVLQCHPRLSSMRLGGDSEGDTARSEADEDAGDNTPTDAAAGSTFPSVIQCNMLPPPPPPSLPHPSQVAVLRSPGCRSFAPTTLPPPSLPPPPLVPLAVPPAPRGPLPPPPNRQPPSVAPSAKVLAAPASLLPVPSRAHGLLPITFTGRQEEMAEVIGTVNEAVEEAFEEDFDDDFEDDLVDEESEVCTNNIGDLSTTEQISVVRGSFEEYKAEGRTPTGSTVISSVLSDNYEVMEHESDSFESMSNSFEVEVPEAQNSDVESYSGYSSFEQD